MIKQYAKGFVDVEIGDIVEIQGEVGAIYDLRFIQELRDNQSFFECRLEDGCWVAVADVKVIERKTKEWNVFDTRSREV